MWSLDAQRAEGANQAARLASIDTVEAPDEQTVVVTLTEPDNGLLYTLTRRGGAVLPADATGLENSANGTGPFRFEAWNVGSSITLTRNDDYWGDAPAISGVTFLYFTDPNAAVNALTTGDVDILTGVNSDLVGPLAGQPRVRGQRGLDERRVHARLQQRARAVHRRERPQGDPPSHRQGGRQRAVQRLRHGHRRTGSALGPVVRGPDRRGPV